MLTSPGGLTDDNVPWHPFLLEAAASISSQPLTVHGLMEVVCEALSDHPEGSASSLTRSDFLQMFRLAAKKLEVAEELATETEAYLEEVALRQGGMLSAQNVSSAECPNLD
jgi:hypothetical protein